MGFLFDSDAISEVFKWRPAPGYLRWLAGLPRAEQFTSAIAIGELFRGAFGSAARARHPVARVYGEIHADLKTAGRIVADADLQIAATAIHHDLAVATTLAVPPQQGPKAEVSVTAGAGGPG